MIASRRLAAASLVSLGVLVPISMLVFGGTAESEFSASHTLGASRIETAVLDIDVGRTVATAAVSPVAPGDRSLLEVELLNIGTLPLLFSMRLQPENSPLAEALTWKQWPGRCDAEPEDEIAADDGAGSRAGNDDDGDEDAGNQDDPAGEGSAAGPDIGAGIALGVGEQTTACLAALLPVDAPNDLQGTVARYDVVVDAVHDLDAS